MSNRPRNLLAVLIVVTALCADRAAFGAPVPKGPVVEQTAAKLIDRLTIRIRKVVPVSGLCVYHNLVAVTSTRPNDITPPAREPAHRPSLPSFFRLPPPALV